MDNETGLKLDPESEFWDYPIPDDDSLEDDPALD